MRRIAVRIYSGTTPFELPEAGTVATLWANKPDGTRVYKLAEAVNDAFVVTLTSQMCAAVGLVNCELQVVGPDGETLTTPRFDIAVEDAMTDGDQVESTDEMTALTEALARVASIEESDAARAEAETKREEAEAERAKAESEREEALAAAVDAAENAVTDMISEADAEVAAAVKTADAAAQRANAAAKAAEDVTAGAVGWDTIPDKPETFPPGAHTHAIADVTGLSEELGGKAPLESPVFTGAPEAPTAAAETSGTQIATTGFVHDAISHDITGKRASGAAVTVSGVIPDTALTEFTVYGRSAQDGTPSPDAPVDIVSAEVESAISCGANLFRGIGVADDEPGYWYEVSNTSSTSEGFARFYSNNSNGTGIAYCDRYSNIAAAKAIEPGKEYKILLELRNVGVVSSDVAFYLDGQYVDGNQYGIFGTINIPVAQIIENARMIYEVKAREDFSDVDLALRTQCHVPAGSACDFEARISIYPADYDVTEYEPYQGTAVPVNLTLRGIPVDAGGNYTDADGQEWICDTYDAVSGEYVQRINKIELKGTEDWADLELDQPQRFRWFCRSITNCKIIAADTLAAVKSSHYKTTTSIDGLNGAMGISVLSTNGALCIYDPTYDTNDVAAWKAYLAGLYTAGTPVTAIYQLSEPVVTCLPPQYIRAYSPVTNAAAGGADIEIEYNNIAGSAYRPPIVIETTLTNTLEYPFNDSETTVALPADSGRVSGNYTVSVEAEPTGGFVGDIVVSEKTASGFRLAYTGSAKGVRAKCYIHGGA